MKKVLAVLLCVLGASCSDDKLTTEPAQEAAASDLQDGVSLFDGSTLTNWHVSEGGEEFWTVKDGAIAGGSLEKKTPRNVWLVSDKSYENFELKFSVKFTDGGGAGLKNSGVQVRSLLEKRKMIGYQIDAGPTWDNKNVNGGLGYWGNIWDESRRKGIVQAENQDQLMESIQQFDGWNHYEVVCNGRNIKTTINGILAHDYTEKNDKVAADGIIALQAHKGGLFLVHFKDIAIKELPATEGSMKWSDEGALKGSPTKVEKAKKEKKK